MTLNTSRLKSIQKSLYSIIKIAGGYKTYLFIVLILMFINILLEAFGLGLLIPLLDLFNKSGDQSFITGKMKIIFNFFNIELNILNVIITMTAIFIIKGIAQFLSLLYAEKVRRRVFVDLTLGCYENLMSVAYAYFHDKKKSDLNLMLSYSTQAAHSVYYLIVFISKVLFLVGYFVFMFYLSFKLSLFVVIVCSVFGIAMLKYTLVFHTATKQITGLKSKFSHMALEAIESIKIVKTYVNEKFEIEKYSKYLKNHERVHYDINKKIAFIQSAREIILFLLVLMVIYYAMEVLDLKFTLVSVYVITLFRCLQMAYTQMNNFNQLVQRLPYAELALDLNSRDNKPYLKNGSREFSGKFKKITFKNVGFSYRKDIPVLNDLNIEIENNRTIAIVGKSGSGKSTFVDLFLRIYDPVKGGIFIDSMNLKEFDIKTFLNKIALVTQDIYIFNDTIENNIRYGKRNATNEEIHYAAKIAHCMEFIEKLPEGFKTTVGDRGVKLSGGQKQRISLARALVKNTPILILDEATSALDSESEKMIQKATNSLLSKKTIIIVAHRLSTIVNADKIIVLENGGKIEEGTHAELMASGKVYSNYYDMNISTT